MLVEYVKDNYYARFHDPRSDDLMISAGSKEELLLKVKTWKTEMEKKGLRVNMGKTKKMRVWH